LYSSETLDTAADHNADPVEALPKKKELKSAIYPPKLRNKKNYTNLGFMIL
jgi:hypothetical protein